MVLTEEQKLVAVRFYIKSKSYKDTIAHFVQEYDIVLSKCTLKRCYDKFLEYGKTKSVTLLVDCNLHQMYFKCSYHFLFLTSKYSSHKFETPNWIVFKSESYI
jgi:hypothetical protein